tara:strand:- start:764 stop:1804 length:1041 start_codon:yes stop_codon:yes gene_type:complete
MKKITVFAPNVRHGGGSILLLQILNELQNKKYIHYAYISESLTDQLSNSKGIIFNNNNLLSRTFAELKLYFQDSKNNKILFFGNMPPAIKLKSHSILYLHNSLLLDKKTAYSFPIKTKVRLVFERFYLRIFLKNVDEIYVQTPKMLKELKKYNKNLNIKLKPFLDNQKINSSVSNNTQSRYDFIYPSYGYSYKNHRLLIDAWIKLSNKGIFPSLLITIDKNTDKKLYKYISTAIRNHNLKIHIYSNVNYIDMQDLYSLSNSLIWPSLTESFGMPIIEAFNAGLKIIAARLEYIDDLLDNIYLFDPYSADDIARNVINCLKDIENKRALDPKLKFLVPETKEFIESL